MLWFQKNQDTFPLPLKYSKMPVFKTKKQWVGNFLQSSHWTVVWNGEIFISPSKSNSLPCFTLSDLARRPVRVPASQDKGVCPPYAQCFTKMIRVDMLFLLGIEGKEKKRICHFRGEAQTSGRYLYCYCRLLRKHCTCSWPIFNLLYFNSAFLRCYDFFKS